MSDLISRQAAIDALDEIEAEVADGYGFQYAKWREYFCGLPSTQPERKKGNWILIADGYTDYVKCDQCGNISYVERNFCPNCGADMRGEQDEY